VPCWSNMKKAYYPQPGSKKEVDANLLGPCGFYCGYCLAYKNGVCLGCRYQAEKSETSGIVEEFCNTLACATKRGFAVCADCEDHPCDKYNPEDSIFSDIYISYLRDKARTPKRR